MYFTSYVKGSYEDLVVKLIRERYPVDEELKMMNMGIEDKTNLKYIEYRDYVLNCKAQAREFIDERNSVIGE